MYTTQKRKRWQCIGLLFSWFQHQLLSCCSTYRYATKTNSGLAQTRFLVLKEIHVLLWMMNKSGCYELTVMQFCLSRLIPFCVDLNTLNSSQAVNERHRYITDTRNTEYVIFSCFFRPQYGPGLDSHLTEMSTENLFGAQSGQTHRPDNLTNIWEPII
jgi:hypothetical protein